MTNPRDEFVELVQYAYEEQTSMGNFLSVPGFQCLTNPQCLSNMPAKSREAWGTFRLSSVCPNRTYDRTVLLHPNAYPYRAAVLAVPQTAVPHDTGNMHLRSGLWISQYNLERRVPIP